MKRNSVSKMINRISRRDSLPLLRGMFVCPEQVRRNKNASINDFFQISPETAETSGTIERVNSLINRASSFSCYEEDGLYLTSEESLYLGG